MQHIVRKTDYHIKYHIRTLVKLPVIQWRKYIQKK